ncbi:MAG TPA: MBL fold metallo-hydrolase [Acidimicrobiia bacterium]|nr:MBL fold metallo-hydrolase [Acidimicrobiia bacterium]
MISITKLAVGPTDNDSYIVACEETSQAVVIDAAAEGERILAACEEVDVGSVITTHGHLDHIGALDQVKESLEVPWLLHLSDVDIAGRKPDEALNGGDEIVIGRIALHVVHTPGHTPGSVSFVFEPDDESQVHVLFSGDTLFPGGPGATRWDYSSFGQIMDSLEKELFPRLPDDTIVHPGHGASTTIGAERPHLGEWRARGW